MKTLDNIVNNPIFKRTTSAIVGVLAAIWLLTDKQLPQVYRLLVSGALTGIGYINLKELTEDQENEFIEIKKQNKKDLLDQAVITVPDKEELIEYPTVYATQYDDATGIAVSIQRILDSLQVRTTYKGIKNAPRFSRYLLGINLDSKLPPYDRISKQLHTNLASLGLSLKTAPIVGVDSGFLTVDLPKDNFSTITYSKSSDLIIAARKENRRVIGYDFNGELVTEPINEFNAFLTLGGMTRSGKSAWIRQDCLEFMLNNPNDKFYLIERKEGTFGLFRDFPQVVESIAYDFDDAEILINLIHEEMMDRIDHARNLAIQDKKKYIEWCFTNKHHLYFDEYLDHESYIEKLEEIFKKGAQYGIRATIGTQMHNRSKSSSNSTVSGALLEQSSTKICFRVQTAIASTQIIQNPTGINLLGYGDCLYKSDLNFEVQRLQTVFYTDDELVELCGKIVYSGDTKKTSKQTIDPLPKFNDLTKKYVKPETEEWKILSLVRDSGKKYSPTAVAKELNLTRNTTLVTQSLELFYSNGLINREKSSNGKGYVYFR